MNPTTISLILCATCSFFVESANLSLPSRSGDDTSPKGKRKVETFFENERPPKQATPPESSDIVMSPDTEQQILESTIQMGISGKYSSAAGGGGGGAVEGATSSFPESEGPTVPDTIKGLPLGQMTTFTMGYTAVKPPPRSISSSSSLHPASGRKTITPAMKGTIERIKALSQEDHEREFWDLAFKSSVKDIKQYLRQHPKFRPTRSDLTYRRLAKIMIHPESDSDLVTNLFQMFPSLFLKKYNYGRSIFHAADIENVDNLLIVYPGEMELRRVLLDEFLNSPHTELLLDERFFNQIVNNNQLLLFLFEKNPEFFLVDYIHLDDGPFKTKLPFILAQLARILPEEGKFEAALAYFKIAAVNTEAPFERSILEGISDENLALLVEVLMQTPAEIVSSEVLHAVLHHPALQREDFNLSTGKSPWETALKLERYDIAEILIEVIN